MKQIGQDGSRVLSEVWAEQAPPQSRLLPEVEGPRQIWAQQLF